MSPLTRGRLAQASAGPATGERVEEIVRVGGVVVNQILSGRLDAAADYLQDHAELAVVLAGGALVEVRGDRLDLAAGDWVLLPADTPHRLVSTQPGTSWLTIHIPPTHEGPRRAVRR